MLVHILSFLDIKTINRCAQVSKQFQCATADWTLYKCVNLRDYRKLINSTSMDTFLERVVCLQKLNVSSSIECSKESLIALIERGGNKLTQLTLNSVDSTDDATIAAIGKCHNIKDLQISNIDASTFLPLGEGLTKLRTLDLNNTFINDSGLDQILKSNVTLKKLCLDECYDIENMDAIVNKFPETLNSFSCRRNETLTHVGVKAIATRCPNLIDLDLGSCLFESEPMDCLAHIARSCKNLQRLSVSFWLKLSDQMLYPIIKGCSKLKVLDISGTSNITAACCLDILSELVDMEEISVPSNVHISDMDVTTWRRKFPTVTIKSKPNRLIR